MITKPILITLVTSLMFCSGCAAKNRWFSRRDYSEMQDPFMQSDAVASTEEPRNGSEEDTGRARLGGLTADSGSSQNEPGTVRLPGPKAIQQTRADAESAARGGRFANASYPQENDPAAPGTEPSKPGTRNPAVRSYQGPALSDFLGRKRDEAAQSSAANTRQASDPAGSQAAATVMSKTGRASETPKLSEEAASFGNFLEQNSSSINTASRQATRTIEKSEEEVTDFSAWAQQQKSEWSRDGSQATANVQSGAKNEFDAAVQQSQRMAEDVALEFNKPGFDSEEVAEPLIRQPGAPRSQQRPQSGPSMAFEEPQKPAPKAEVNPFENPFDFGEAEPVAASPGAARPGAAATPAASSRSTTPRKALDDTFQMDNGWKPAHVKRP